MPAFQDNPERSRRIETYDYALDESLIAQAPLGDRPSSRLMRLCRGGGAISHHAFRDLPNLLRRGDLLVVNDTKVIPAKFLCRRSSGGRIEGLFLRELSAGLWQVLLRGAGRCRPGERLRFERAETPSSQTAKGGTVPVFELELAVNEGQGQWQARADPPMPAQAFLEQVGQTPLPPYIRRPKAGTIPFSAVRKEGPSPLSDADRYQTVYADRPGAVAAPTAGLHFTPELFDELNAAGVEVARVTLHVGMGTFLPVKVDDVAQHKMHSEWYELLAAAEAINAARREGRRVVAVGTTSVRVLESVAAGQQLPDKEAPLQPASGWTDIFIYPPYEFRVVDALITNFHLPRSTLLMLASAFASPDSTAGIERVKHAYAVAQQERYRFFSYGDAMLIE